MPGMPSNKDGWGRVGCGVRGAEGPIPFLFSQEVKSVLSADEREGPCQDKMRSSKIRSNISLLKYRRLYIKRIQPP